MFSKETPEKNTPLKIRSNNELRRTLGKFSQFLPKNRRRKVQYSRKPVITVRYSSSCLDHERTNGPFAFRVKLPPVQAYPIRWRLQTVPVIFNAERQKRKL